jgi:hypothetical protein
MNDYSSAALIEVFARAGFRCDHVERFRKQQIFRFSRISAVRE